MARDVRIEKNIEWNDSTNAKKNKSNNKIENILPIVMKFAQVITKSNFQNTVLFIYYYFSF